MQAFTRHTGLVVPLQRSHVDTDAIIPKQFLKSIKRSGFGVHLFDEWRYLDPGELGQDPDQRSPNPEFVLNQVRYQGASILLAGDNFGCGSSREHAVWALLDYGFRCVIASSFADIFYNNSFKSGLLPVALPEATVQQLFQAVNVCSGYQLTIDLAAQIVITPEGETFEFNVDSFRKNCLIQGLDEIDLTLQHSDDIRAYEARRRQEAPWLFP